MIYQSRAACLGRLWCLLSLWPLLNGCEQFPWSLLHLLHSLCGQSHTLTSYFASLTLGERRNKDLRLQALCRGWVAWQAQQRWRSSIPMWEPELATTRTLGILSTRTAKPWRLKPGLQFPLSSFTDDSGTSSKVSGVFGHGWSPTSHRRPLSPEIFCTYPKTGTSVFASDPLPFFPDENFSLSNLFFFWLPFQTWDRG